MNSRLQSQGADGESLQADVMRFMAIIAFCLIAILALVRSVDTQQPVEQEPETRLSAGGEAAEPAELAALETPESAPERTPPGKEPERRFEPIIPLPEPENEQAPVPAEPADPPIVELARVVLHERPRPVPDAHPASQAVHENPKPDGLVLRFVSDGDFLRLIAKGDVTVYAFAEREFLALDQNYEFHDAPPPKQVYEVLPETIPDLIDAALTKRDPPASGFKWGISLPQRVERQIQHYVNTVTAGQLVIDRYGEVRHVASS